jgi:hypothetical protein
MFTEFDQNTIAFMTAALEHVCKKIPPDKDSHELRKRIADEIIACGRSGKRTLLDFQNAGSDLLREMTQPPSFWRGLFERK